MAVTPEVLLAAAEALGRGTSEVDWRNAASRGYYAAFHRCRLVARDARLPLPERGSVHAGLIEALTNNLNPLSLKGLGYMLAQCRTRRADADYRIDQDFPQRMAQTVLSESRRILDKAEAL